MHRATFDPTFDPFFTEHILSSANYRGSYYFRLIQEFALSYWLCDHICYMHALKFATKMFETIIYLKKAVFSNLKDRVRSVLSPALSVYDNGRVNKEQKIN